MPDEYDVLIVGARVAGASLALLLGQQGHRVLMVDRDHFPSDTLSTHFMSPLEVGRLAKLGVLADVEAAGFRRLTRTRTYIEDCLFEGPIGPGGAFGLAPRRDSLDSVLIQHATTRGRVEFWEQTHVEGLIEQDGRVSGVVVRSPGGAQRDVRARVVVGADGKYSRVAEWVHAATYNDVPALRPAYYGYYHGVAPLPEAAVELFFSHDRLGFIFPMQPDVDCLALELQPEDFDTFRADPGTVFEQWFRVLPGMAARMQGAHVEHRVQGTRGIANYFRQPYGPGWALTGDAGYLKDPITGFGIGDALSQAFLLADALDSTLGGAAWEATMSAFQRKRDEAMLPAYHYTLSNTRMRDGSAESLAWMRASLASPFFARALMAGLPSVVSQAMPADFLPRLTSVAQAFGVLPVAATPATVPVVPAGEGGVR